MVSPGSVRRLLPLVVFSWLGTGLALAQTADTKTSPPARLSLRLTQEIFEIGSVVRGELVLENPSSQTIGIPAGGDLAKSFRLIDAANKEHEATKPEQFGAAHATELGPGGFTGISFDASLLFPQLGTAGRYTLAYRGAKGLNAKVEFAMIPGFDPSKHYQLELALPSGAVQIDIDSKTAPAAARHIVQLARVGFFNGASIALAVPSDLVVVRGPVKPSNRISPFEPAKEPVLAGMVVLEPAAPSVDAPGRSSWPNLSIALAPKPEWTGQVVSIGRVIAGLEELNKISTQPTTGKDGKPPFQPITAVKINTATVREVPPKTP